MFDCELYIVYGTGEINLISPVFLCELEYDIFPKKKKER
jgi:hypothetical protein